MTAASALSTTYRCIAFQRQFGIRHPPLRLIISPLPPPGSLAVPASPCPPPASCLVHYSEHSRMWGVRYRNTYSRCRGWLHAPDARLHCTSHLHCRTTQVLRVLDAGVCVPVLPTDTAGVHGEEGPAGHGGVQGIEEFVQHRRSPKPVTCALDSGRNLPSWRRCCRPSRSPLADTGALGSHTQLEPTARPVKPVDTDGYFFGQPLAAGDDPAPAKGAQGDGRCGSRRPPLNGCCVGTDRCCTVAPLTSRLSCGLSVSSNTPAGRVCQCAKAAVVSGTDRCILPRAAATTVRRRRHNKTWRQVGLGPRHRGRSL